MMWLRVVDARRSCAIAVRILPLENVECVDSTMYRRWKWRPSAAPCSADQLISIVRTVFVSVCCTLNFGAKRIIPGRKSHAAEFAVLNENRIHFFFSVWAVRCSLLCHCFFSLVCIY